MLITKPPESCNQEDFFISGEESASAKIACSLVYHRSAGTVAAGGSAADADPLVLIRATIDTGKPVVVICHGAFSWRNQMLLSNLALGLAGAAGCHALRFDFRGNGQSSGPWRYAGYDGELEDLRSVVRFLREVLECRVVCVIGHSKGATAALRLALEHECDGAEMALRTNGQHDSNCPINNVTIPCFVNLAGRFAVCGAWDRNEALSKDQLDELSRTGKVLFGTKGGHKLEATERDLEEKEKNDLSAVSEIQRAAVLTIHGGMDNIVPVNNAHKFAAAIPRHQLHIIERADHNLSGMRFVDEMVSTIAAFISRNPMRS